MRPADIGKLPLPPADFTFSYGQDTNQIGELRLPVVREAVRSMLRD
jgi:hypothetical protein